MRCDDFDDYCESKISINVIRRNLIVVCMCIVRYFVGISVIEVVYDKIVCSDKTETVNDRDSHCSEEVNSEYVHRRRFLRRHEERIYDVCERQIMKVQSLSICIRSLL